MRFVLFYHSLVSDWNHRNAHFLRGIVSELLERGHAVEVYEPRDGWSRGHLLHSAGYGALQEFAGRFPRLRSRLYDPAKPNLDVMLDGADVVLVHEWNPPELIAQIGAQRAASGDYRLLFHDTHHRSVTDSEGMAAYDLSGYDGVLAFGRVIRDAYLERGWAPRAWVWHDAADTRIFRPIWSRWHEGDLVWIGNWGDDERARDLHEFLLEPVRRLGLRARAHGVRYPAEARQALAEAGIEYEGWLPNYRVPEVFSKFRVTVHIPRRPYREALPGIPTIRVFEALACGIPLVCAEWDDAEGLFTPGEDYLVAGDADEMTQQLEAILNEGGLARSLAEHGRRTILARHTCAHRVDELLAICAELGAGTLETAELQSAVHA
jgi:spore maturation protein CgeB